MIHKISSARPTSGANSIDRPTEEGNVPEDLQGNSQDEQGDAKENALKGVKADEAPLVIGLQYQKNDCRDNGHIGQHSGDVVC